MPSDRVFSRLPKGCHPSLGKKDGGGGTRPRDLLVLSPLSQGEDSLPVHRVDQDGRRGVPGDQGAHDAHVAGYGVHHRDELPDRKEEEQDGEGDEDPGNGPGELERGDGGVAGEDPPGKQEHRQSGWGHLGDDPGPPQEVEAGKTDPERAEGAETGAAEDVRAADVPHPGQELGHPAVEHGDGHHDAQAIGGHPARVHDVQDERGQGKPTQPQRAGLAILFSVMESLLSGLVE